MPAWASPIIAHRALLAGTALVIRRANDQVEYWKLVFMVQQPYYLAMCPLRPAEHMQACSALLEPPPIVYSFTCNYADCQTADEVPVDNTDHLSILFRLRHNGGVHVSSDSVPVGLAQLVEGVAGQGVDGTKEADGGASQEGSQAVR